MFFYVISLMCTVMPCAHVINTEGVTASLVKSDGVIPLMQDSPPILPQTLIANNSFVHDQPISSENQKTGRAYFPSHRSKFIVNQLHSPVQDEPVPAAENFMDNQNPIVTIKDGSLKGSIMKTITNRSFAAFQGIPFAQPPVGALRFVAPQRNLPWNGVRDAIEPSPQCIQSDYMKQYFVHGKEDCLYLNVYTPNLSLSRKQKLPVMVFIHGGGFFFGSSAIYKPTYFLDQDVVLVSMNYRLGPFGFLSTGDDIVPGNNGLKDQTLALRWVSENIGFFGGDANSITIFGESAGASSVQFHFLSPLSRGLFHRGISQSGCATCFWSIDEQAPKTAKKFGAMLNCNGKSSQELVDCLRRKDAMELVSKHVFFLEWLMYPVVVFGPVVEPKNVTDAFLSEQPEEIYKQNKVANVPWISGYNKDEGAVNIAVLFLDNKTLPQLNNEWKKYGPTFLNIKSSENDFEEIVEKIRNFYLNDNDITFENRNMAIEMFGDRYSVSCGLKAMRYHSKHTSQPVYAYHLSYSGKYSIVQLLGQNSEDWGVSHLNDLVYQFNNTDYYPALKLEDEEYQFSKIMNTIWANFATYGKPYMNINGQMKDIWKPIKKTESFDSPLQFLDLNMNPKMIENPFAKRDQFWRDLGLND